MLRYKNWGEKNTAWLPCWFRLSNLGCHDLGKTNLLLPLYMWGLHNYPTSLGVECRRGGLRNADVSASDSFYVFFWLRNSCFAAASFDTKSYKVLSLSWTYRGNDLLSGKRVKFNYLGVLVQGSVYVFWSILWWIQSDQDLAIIGYKQDIKVLKCNYPFYFYG
jgi:hypothetical protein